MADQYQISYTIRRKTTGENGAETEVEETKHETVSDPYQVLSLAQNADIDLIRERVKQLSLRYHPDKGNLADGSEEKNIRLRMQQEINAAAAILLNAQKRASLDLAIKRGQKLATEPAAQTPQQGEARDQQPRPATREEQVSLHRFILEKIHNAVEIRDLLDSATIAILETQGKISPQEKEEILTTLQKRYPEIYLNMINTAGSLQELPHSATITMYCRQGRFPEDAKNLILASLEKRKMELQNASTLNASA